MNTNTATFTYTWDELTFIPAVPWDVREAVFTRLLNSAECLSSRYSSSDDDNDDVDDGEWSTTIRSARGSVVYAPDTLAVESVKINGVDIATERVQMWNNVVVDDDGMYLEMEDGRLIRMLKA